MSVNKVFICTVETSDCAACETESIVLVAGANEDMPQVAYDPDNDYVLVACQDVPTGIRFYRYDCTSNSLTLKHTLSTASWNAKLVLADGKFWFMAADGNFYRYDPATETIADSFGGSIAGSRLIWVESKSKGYFLGTGNHICEVDFTAKTVTDLGATIALGYNLTYSPTDDSIYGCHIGGGPGNVWRFDLSTNTPTNLGVPAVGINLIVGVWDSDASVIRFFSDVGGMAEYDPSSHTVTDTVLGMANAPYGQSDIIYDPDTKFVVGVDSNGNLCYYDVDGEQSYLVSSDTDYYDTIAMIASRNIISGIMNDGAGTNAGMQKVCIST